jgi:hypothetical protein
VGWNLLRATSWLVGFGLVNRSPPEVTGPGSDTDSRPCGIGSGPDVEACCSAASQTAAVHGMKGRHWRTGASVKGVLMARGWVSKAGRSLYGICTVGGSKSSRMGRMRQDVEESRGRGSAVAAGGGPGTRAGCHMGYGSAARCDCGRRGSVGLGGGERFRCGRPGAVASLFSVKRWAFSGGLFWSVLDRA